MCASISLFDVTSVRVCLCFNNVLLFSLGLKKFLTQYPSLFYIVGDYVHINSYQSTNVDDSTSGYGNGKRDYIQEAKEYFKNKLLYYGLGTEVPIKSLLGHRSQASPQVRHISGKYLLGFFRNLLTGLILFFCLIFRAAHKRIY